MVLLIMAFICARILSFIPRMERRMERRALLASSAISSSERMQRRISSHNGVSGSICANRSVRESVVSSSFSERENAFARFAASSSEQMESSSIVLSEPPISRRFREPFISRTPEKESRPPLNRRFKASFVSSCKRSISALSQMGRRESACSFASSQQAYSASCAMILLYSKVFNAFSFIIVVFPI